MFLETSALTGENVEEGFLKCARTILNKIDSGTLLHFSLLLISVFARMKSRDSPSLLYNVCIADILHHGSLSKASWTQRGWVQVSSMEMLRWGSCDSREAPPHRISNSVIARGRGAPPSPPPTGPHRQDAPYRSVLNKIPEVKRLTFLLVSVYIIEFLLGLFFCHHYNINLRNKRIVKDCNITLGKFLVIERISVKICTLV